MRKKKKGASLITVVIIFAILITLGTATLSLAATDYNLRVGESNRVRNLYYSESGIDVTYSVIGKLTEGAILNGNKAVSSFMDTLNGTGGILEKERQAVKNKDTSVTVKYINSDGTINETKIKEDQNTKFKEAYRKYFTENISPVGSPALSKVIYAIENSLYYEDKTNSGVETVTNITFNTSEKPTINVDKLADALGNRTIDFDGSDKLDLTIQSSFQTTVTADTSLAHQPFNRIIKVKYTINVPNYNDSYLVETKKLQIPVNTVWRKAIAVDGDLNIDGNLNVDGDIFVKGSDNTVSDQVYDKYKGGIMIQASNNMNNNTNDISSSTNKKVNLQGTVVTTKSFNLKGGSSVVIDNSASNNSEARLFASNVYVGKSISTDTDSVGSNLTVNGKVYTDNDLALNSKSSTINISKFYGMDDLNVSKQTGTSRAGYSNERVSSSILVNTDDIGAGNTNSKITIRDEAYIMGTAYIKTNPIYQTGESVAVKGNYIAYASQLDGDAAKGKGLDSSKVYYGYYNPLQLVDKFDNSATGVKQDNMNFEQKSDYFKLYSDEGDNKNNLKINGISLPAGTVSIGAFITKEGNQYVIKSSTYSLKSETDVRDQKEKYTTEVFEMGNAKGISDLQDKYTKGDVEKTVANQVYFNNISGMSNVNPDGNGDTILLNKDTNKKVVIAGYGESVTGDIVIKAPSSGKINGVIVTAGNVEIRGSVNFKGTIIAGGNLVLTGDTSTKTLTYDAPYVERVIAYHYDTFKNLFNTTNPISTQNIEVGTSVLSAENEAGHRINTDKLITKKAWTIVK